MIAADYAAEPEAVTPAAASAIPIQNLWLLLVYASGLARFRDRFDTELESSPDLPDLFGRLLTFVTERRLRRHLSRAYRPRAAVLKRVRGRIDLADTFLHDRLRRGEVACRFDELTVDTPRNRFVRAALERLGLLVADRELAHRCRTLARDLGRLGVSPGRPSRNELARDPIARHQADDLLMIAIARLAFDMLLPTESPGEASLSELARNEMILFEVFEKAIAGFYEHELAGEWSVHPQRGLDWGATLATGGLVALLPGMRPDLVLQHAASGRRIILDTKFTRIVKPGQYGGERFSSAHLYQLYAYLRSQAGRGDGKADAAEGILLHPAIAVDVDEAMTVQGHRIRFATVNLAAPAEDIRNRLLHIAEKPI